MIRVLLALFAGGCSAVDDFGRFRVTAGDGAMAADAGTAFDGARLPDLTSAPARDLSFADLAVLPQPHCGGLPRICGPAAAGDCCESLIVTGGAYNRGNDANYPATVSDFRLDRYEITVGRFRAFAAAGRGTQAAPPPAGAGANPKIAGTGWDAAWDLSLPADSAALAAALLCGGAPPTWTAAATTNEALPIDCITWYEAFAFCAWDGGWLPPEAQWNFAAAGGGEQRLYPSGNAITHTLAAYSPDAIAPVGSRSPGGDGRWGHADLAGNVWEWTFDYGGPFSVPCLDCAELAPFPGREIWGGSVAEGAAGVVTFSRVAMPPDRRGYVGARCARPI